MRSGLFMLAAGVGLFVLGDAARDLSLLVAVPVLFAGVLFGAFGCERIGAAWRARA